ncbi:helix-turn-helix domain-containing protein [Streptomyces sp. WMMC905]|uniref:helix-turn-helix domain-containing protein n=1 Tax=Streptomyces sp. WMMC905 TaxID=3404123 RepID=UPI003B94C6BD
MRGGLTQQQLADFAALSVRTIRDLEHGRVERPRQDTLRLLARNVVTLARIVDMKGPC